MAKRQERGFTLIEVVLVLALAGLILIIVFLAVAGTQRARRDAQRKNDVARVAADVIAYTADHNQTSPDVDATNWDTFITQYIDHDNLKDPSSGAVYDMPYRDWESAGHADEPAPGQIFVQAGHWCNRGTGADATSNPIAGDDVIPTRFAVWGGLETGGYICVDNY